MCPVFKFDTSRPHWINPSPIFHLMPNSYRVTVQELQCEPIAPPKPSDFVESGKITVTPMREIFTQTFSESDFDLQSLVLALNKRKRVRKARGKEVV